MNRDTQTRTIRVTEERMHLARQAAQLHQVSMHCGQDTESDDVLVVYRGRHSDEAASLLLQMILRQP